MKNIWVLLMVLIVSSLQATTPTEKHIQLTDEEKAWITQNPVINFTGDPDWLPFEGFTKEEKYIGIIPEILKIIEQQTSLKFNVIPTKSWSESVSMLKNGKVGMLTVSDAWKDPHYLYTKSIIPSNIVVVAKKDHPYVDSVYYLQYESVAIIKGYRYTNEIKKKYPDYPFYEVENIQEGLEGVATGKYDALLASMALATYNIERMQLANVRVVGKTKYAINARFAVRKEISPLVGIINKVKIGDGRAHELLKEWTYQKYVEKTDYALITELILLLIVVILAAVVLYLLLKRKSKKHKSTESFLSDTQKNIDDAAKYALLLDDPSQLHSQDLSIFFDDSFSISNPKNIKSSTFIYFDLLSDNKAVLMLIDANGNSIESILNAMFIKRFVKTAARQIENGSFDTDPASILGSMDREIIQAIDAADPKHKPDNAGFDAAVITIDKINNTLHYAGANIPLFYVQDDEVLVKRADKYSVGSGNRNYTNHNIKIIDTMEFYLMTRGYIDQTGGKQNLPLGKRRIKEILGEYRSHNMDVQKNALVKAFREHIGNNTRAGDITLLGFRITEDNLQLES